MVKSIGSSFGFTLLEVILVVSLTASIFLGVYSFFLSNLRFFYSLHERSEVWHQLRTGLEGIVSELQEADPETITLLQKDLQTNRYTQVQFSKFRSPDLYWFYLNTKDSLIRGLKRPTANWGRISLATTIHQLFFQRSSTGLIEIQLVTRLKGKDLRLLTSVFPGFKN